MPEFKTKEKAYDECIVLGYFIPQKEIDAEKIKANVRKQRFTQ